MSSSISSSLHTVSVVMHYRMKMASLEHYVFFLINPLMIIHLVPLTVAQQPNLILPDCTIKGSAADDINNTFAANLNTLLTSFSTTTVDYGFYDSAAGNNSDRVNAIGLCRPDLSRDECRSCMNTSTHAITKECPDFKEAAIYYDTCTLHYSNLSISGIMESGFVYSVEDGNGNFSDVNQAYQTLSNFLRGLQKEAAKGGPHWKFAAGEVVVNGYDTIYALIQCTPYLQETQCVDCVNDLIWGIASYMDGSKGGMLFGPSCNLRYDTTRFYRRLPQDDASSNLPSPLPSSRRSSKAKRNNTGRVVVITIVPTVVLMFLIISIYLVQKTRGKTEVTEIPSDEDNEDTLDVESLLFKLNAIRAATDNFSSANKLGRGGFGDVFKGVLPSGQEIAVKRLSVGSNQGDIEFKNEVLFLAKLQHRNLIKLIGFCLEGGEKLLIYELVPNSSLDHFIFDPAKSACLDWEKRYKIIRGIARGLLYLHEDSCLRIIHRDLKASNILLDANLNPKISDFGLAKLFPLDQTHVNTRRIAGTYGYMAPEYAYHGHFSVKSDVYSFGIMVLEILSGRKTASRNGEELQHLVGYAWRKWTEGTILDIVDPTLGVLDYSRSEIMRCFHIGLLCVQESVANRPTMSSIVSMLNNHYTSLPLPSRPGFLLHSITQAMEHDSQITRSNVSEQFSLNGASMTDLHPR